MGQTRAQKALAAAQNEAPAVTVDAEAAAAEIRIAALEARLAAAGWPIGEQEDPLDLAGRLAEGFAAQQAKGSAFGDTLVALGFCPGEDESCYAAATVELERLARFDKLIGDATVAIVPEEGKSPLETLIAAAAASSVRVGELSQAEQVALNKVDDLTAELATAREDLVKAQDALAVAKGETAKTRRAAVPRAGKARKVGELKEIDRDALAAAMAETDDPFQIVFSNGTTEIIELNPIAVYPAAFRPLDGGRYRLLDDILVKGTRDGTRVRGLGLVVDGVQLGWMGLLDPVDLPAGQERKFQVTF